MIHQSCPDEGNCSSLKALPVKRNGLGYIVSTATYCTAYGALQGANTTRSPIHRPPCRVVSHSPGVIVEAEDGRQSLAVRGIRELHLHKLLLVVATVSHLAFCGLGFRVQGLVKGLGLGWGGVGIRYFGLNLDFTTSTNTTHPPRHRRLWLPPRRLLRGDRGKGAGGTLGSRKKLE